MMQTAKRRSPAVRPGFETTRHNHESCADCSTSADTIHDLDHDAWIGLDDFQHTLFSCDWLERVIAEALRVNTVAESDLRAIEGAMRRAGRYLERARRALSALQHAAMPKPRPSRRRAASAQEAR